MHKRVVVGHTFEEYMSKYREFYDNGSLWDFSLEDFSEEGTVETRNDVEYWLIKDDSGEWRIFEAL